MTNSEPDRFLCRPASESPPKHREIAIYALSTTGFREWFKGSFDGNWHTGELPPGRWYVLGWKPLQGPPGEVDCRQLAKTLDAQAMPLLQPSSTPQAPHGRGRNGIVTPTDRSG